MTAPQTAATTDPRNTAELQQVLDAALAREAALAEALAARDAALAQRNSEYGERIGHQAATIDVLKAMSASPGDPQPVFDLIARQAANQCNVPTAAVATYDGAMMHLAAQSGLGAAYVAQFPRPVGLDFSMGRAVLNRRVDQVEDITADPGHSFAPVLGSWSVIAVPILRDCQPLGAITIGRPAMGPFSDSQIALLKTFAEQAVIAITSAETYRALQTRTSELTIRDTENRRLIARQEASIEVLRTISASPDDPQPAFELIARRARDLCNAAQASVTEYDGALLHMRARDGYDSTTAQLGDPNWPQAPNPDTVHGRVVLSGEIVHVRDLGSEGVQEGSHHVMMRRRLGSKSLLGVPLLRDGRVVGAIAFGRAETGGFDTAEIALVESFAEQATIAITSAANIRALRERTADLQESLEYQTATGDVLKVISRSTFDLQPVLDTLVATAARLCDAEMAAIGRREGDLFRLMASLRFPADFVTERQTRGAFNLSPTSVTARAVRECRAIQIHDVAADPDYPQDAITVGKQRSSLGVPLLREGDAIGVILLARQRVEPFTDRQIELVSTFADQAVIAIENTRLITEQQEALEQQTATAEVLQVINASPGNLTPVFEAILEKAIRLCDAEFGHFRTYDGERFSLVAVRGDHRFVGVMQQRAALVPGPHHPLARIIAGEEVNHIVDAADSDAYRNDPRFRELVDTGVCRSLLGVALRKGKALLGYVVVYRQEVRPFSDKQIALLQNFAEQAVIAMENARLLDEIRQRQEELRVTFENMGDGVAMFDETQHLVAWNRKFQDILDVPDDIIARRQTFSEYVRYLAERGEYGAGPDVEEQVRQLTEQAGQYRAYERTRPDGRVIEIRHNPVPSGGFVLIYADITERKHNEAEIRAARDAAEAAFRDLKSAQANLIQAEKMASLGQLTAGIAHEIKNPLNFINNFAALSVDLLGELKETAAPGFAALTDNQRADIDDVSAMLTSNLEKITEHGKRADGIVKAMLEHSRGSSAERRTVDLNVLIDEALSLAYHGARAQDQSFNITLERDFDAGIAPIEVNPQDMTRVFLNIFSNGFYAATRRARNGGDAGFMPTLKVTTRDADGAVEIRVRDNGSGIPVEIRDKLFQPFFTTKPTGEGTGLGLSITYDIVTKQHGGTITVESEVDAFTEFVVTLPRQMFTNSDGRA